jgi:hypothetical protein
MSDHQLDLTPYEKFLRNSLEDEKKKLAELNEKLARAGRLKKFQLKRQLDEVNQNIEVLSRDLRNYQSGLHWLRERSKERDEIAERLKPVPIEAIMAQAPKPAATGARQGARPTPTVGARPPSASTVGRPVVGQPVGTQAQSGAQPRPNSPSTQQQAPRVGTPVVGRPVGAPTVGKPIGTATSKNAPQQPAEAQSSATSEQKQAKPEEAQKTGSEQEASKPQTVSRVSAPVIGKPMGTPTPRAPRVGVPITSQVQPARGEGKKEKQQQETKESGASAQTEQETEEPEKAGSEGQKTESSDPSNESQSG